MSLTTQTDLEGQLYVDVLHPLSKLGCLGLVSLSVECNGTAYCINADDVMRFWFKTEEDALSFMEIVNASTRKPLDFGKWVKGSIDRVKLHRSDPPKI
jgi:hypothetical protein